MDTYAPVARDVQRFVHGHPELGYEEYQSSEYLAATLAKAGYAIERNIAGMPTAFRAVLNGARSGRTVGLVVVYDAVPTVRPDGAIEAVHSCGHGPLAGGVCAAAAALASLREQLAGRIVVVGCPADEIHASVALTHGGGKALTAAAGLWDGVDAALYAHPEFINTVSRQSLWMRRDRARIFGRRSLKSEVVSTPLAVLRDLSTALERSDPGQVMLERLELDGDVEEGTSMALDATFLLFAEDKTGIEALASGLREGIPGVTWTHGSLVCGVQPDDNVTQAVSEAFVAAGRDFDDNPPTLPFATDFGNISRLVPAALIGIGRAGGWRYHTDEGAGEFASSAGDDAALGIAKVLTLAATRLSEAS